MSKTLSPPPSKRLERLIPLALFVGAFGFRLIGIGWGLPNELHNHSYHPDEPIVWAYAQEIEPRKLDFDPGFYNYGTLYLTLLRVASDVVAGYGGGPDPKDPTSQWTYIGKCLLAGRIISALFGAGTVLLAFLILRRWVGPLAASLGALVIGVAPAHVVHSRFASVDVTATFFIAASAYFAMRILTAPGESPSEPEARERERNLLRNAILSGAFAGLSAGTKYTGILALFSLLVALIIAKPKGSWKLGGWAFLAAIIAFLISTPGILVNWSKFAHDFTAEMIHTSTGHGLYFVDVGSGFAYHIFNLVYGVGGLVVLLCILGLTFAPKRLHAPMFVLLAFAIPYYIVIGRSQVMFLRYTFPLYIILAFGMACLIAKAQESWKQGRWVVALSILALGGVPFWGGLRAAAQMTVWMIGEDPRDTVAKMLKTSLAKDPNATVGLVSDPWYYTPPVFPDSGAPRRLFFEYFDVFQALAKKARALQFVPPNPQERYNWDVRLLDQLKPTYVVYTSFEAEDLERLKDRQLSDPVVRLIVSRYKEVMLELTRNYNLIAIFGGDSPPVHDLQYIRPSVWVWKRKQGS